MGNSRRISEVMRMEVRRIFLEIRGMRIRVMDWKKGRNEKAVFSMDSGIFWNARERLEMESPENRERIVMTRADPEVMKKEEGSRN